MDWSYVLIEVLWFHLRMNGVNCSWMKNTISYLLEKEHVDYSSFLVEDEFFLVADGENLLAHKSIISAKSDKLAARIRFTKGSAKECPSADRLAVHVDLPLLVAKMLLCHCYHGSITFGLMKSPTKQCHQLLEMALVADEYLCPSLLLECKIRLLMQTSSRCEYICPYCSTAGISLEGQIDCPIWLQCFERAEKNLGNDSPSLYCEPVGVYAYSLHVHNVVKINWSHHAKKCNWCPCRCSTIGAVFLSPAGTSHDEILSIWVYWRPKFNNDYAISLWLDYADNNIGAGCISVPFASTKMMAIWTMLCDFPAVIRSDSYLRQIKSDDDEDDIAQVDDSFAIGWPGDDEDSILLVRTCLEELACSPFNKK